MGGFGKLVPSKYVKIFLSFKFLLTAKRKTSALVMVLRNRFLGSLHRKRNPIFSDHI